MRTPEAKANIIKILADLTGIGRNFNTSATSVKVPLVRLGLYLSYKCIQVFVDKVESCTNTILKPNRAHVKHNL